MTCDHVHIPSSRADFASDIGSEGLRGSRCCAKQARGGASWSRAWEPLKIEKCNKFILGDKVIQIRRSVVVNRRDWPATSSTLVAEPEGSPHFAEVSGSRGDGY